MAFASLIIYLTTAATANRRDKPYGVNTTGSLIDFGGGASGILDWASDNNRKAWGRIDGSYFDYYELEALSATSIRVSHTDELGDNTTTDVTVAAATTYTTLVPGVSITTAGTITTGHISRVYPGIFALDNNTYYDVRGAAGDNVKLLVNNPGTVTHKLCQLAIGRGGWFENTSGSALAAIRWNDINPIADVYALTISNGSVSGKKFTFTGSLNTFIADNVAAGSTNNAVVGSPGWTFDAGAAPANTDTAELTVSDYADGLQLAPDNAGVPGTWVDWDDTVGLLLDLNRAGYTDQQIPAAQTITCWVRWNGDITHPIGRGNARLYTISYQAET